MQKTICFAYESGEAAIPLDQEMVEKYFVFAAVLVREPDLEEAIEGASRIEQKWFPLGEMSSAAIGAATELRKKVVALIANLPIQIVILAIEREELLKDSGVTWQKAFFQYISRLLFAKLISSFQPIEILQSQA